MSGMRHARTCWLVVVGFAIAGWWIASLVAMERACRGGEASTTVDIATDERREVGVDEQHPGVGVADAHTHFIGSHLARTLHKSHAEVAATLKQYDIDVAFDGMEAVI